MMMHPLIWKHFSKLKDGSGNYLWNNCPALRDVQVIENKWMPSTLSAGTRAVLAGDFRRAVRIKNFGLRIYTTTENTVENGQMKVIGFQEMDVALVDNGALKALQTAAS